MARDPKVEVEVTAQSRTLSQRLAEARAKIAKFGGEVRSELNGAKMMKEGWSKAGASVLGNFGSRAASAAGDWITDQAKSAWQYADALKRLQIQAGKSPEYMQTFSDSIRRASDQTGINKNQILAAARQYVALTGDMDGAAGSIGTWARVAQASEASIQDVASTAQALRDNLKIKPEEMEAAFGALITQGKEGAVELKDLASQLAIISPMMAQFSGGTGLGGLRELGAVVQVVRKGFGGTEETITGVQSLMTALIKNASKFQHAGVQIFDRDPKTGVKSLRNFHDIITAIGSSKLMRDPTKLEKAFGRVEAYRAFLQLKDNGALLDDLVEKSKDAGVVQRDLDSYLQSAAGRTSVAWEQAKNKLAEAFTPDRIEQFTNVLVTLIGALGKIAGKIGDVLDGVKGASEGVAELFGGKSEDTKAMEAARRQQRKRIASATQEYLIEHPVERGDEEGMKAALQYAMRKVTAEDAISRRVGAPAGDGSNANKVMVANQEWGLGQSLTKMVDENSVEGLQQLRASPAVQNATNAKVLTQQIDAAIARQVKDQNDKIVAELRKIAENTGKNTKVSVDGKNIAEASRQSKKGTRPGG